MTCKYDVYALYYESSYHSKYKRMLKRRKQNEEVF